MVRWPVAVAIVLSLTACAAGRAYQEGNALLAEGKLEPGLSKLDEAVRLDPHNAEYRIALAGKRAAVINGLNLQADQLRQQGSLSEAEKLYFQTLRLDVNNAAAKQGIGRVVTARRHKQLVDEAEALFRKGGADNLADVADKVRAVLVENPVHSEALNLRNRLNEQKSRQRPPEAQLAAAFRKPITLEFRDAPLRSIFDVIAKVSGLNFFFDKDVRPDLKATVLSKQTSIEDAVRILLVTNQLEQMVLNDNSVLIYPNTPQKVKDYQPLSVRTFFLANADVKAVANTIKTILKVKDVVVDERLSLLVMRDTPEAIRMAERLIAVQDLNDPEVMLEVEVLEVKRSSLSALGINWPDSVGLTLVQAGGGGTSSGTGTGTGAALGGTTTLNSLNLGSLRNINKSNFNVAIGGVTINAKNTSSDSNILANPRIRVRNKEKAKILIGDRVPVITTTSTATGFVADSVSYVDVGLKLDVEPNIYLDEEVAIKVNLEVSSIVREVASKSGTLSYQIGTRNASTVLRLKDGETQVLAGLISDEDRSSAAKVPGIGALPVLNRLFGTVSDDRQRSEIVLSITPHLIRSVSRPDLAAAEFKSGTESNIGGQELALTAFAGEADPGVAKAAAPTAAPAPAKDGPDAARGVTERSTVPAAPAAPVPVPAAQALPAAAGGPIVLGWQGPAQVRAGDQFSAVLRVTSGAPLTGLPLLVGFDPSMLQVVNVMEGDFLKQAQGKTSFNSRIDPAQGKVFVAAVRIPNSASDTGINGVGNVVVVNFKALKPGPASVQLLSVTPAPALPVALPNELVLKIQ